MILRETIAQRGYDWRSDGPNLPVAMMRIFPKTVDDTKTGELGTADPLVERTSYPSSTIVGDTLYCLGGESGPHHWPPTTLEIGTIVGPVR